MKRRDFLKFTSTGLAVVAVGSMADWPAFWRGSQAHASSFGLDRLELEMVAVDAEMVDGIPVPMWAFKIDDDDHEGEGMEHHITAARIPGPALVALAGDRIRLRITNSIAGTRTHRFAIPGVTLTVNGTQMDSVVVPHDDRVDIEFTAPAPGTYMYLDPENAPINRMMGLHGVLVSMANPVGNNTPYLSPTSNIQKLFNDLGTAPHFSPGNPWDMARNTIWVFNVIDSEKFGDVAESATALPSSTFMTFVGGNRFLPDYFTINGKSGFFGAQHSHHSDEMDVVHDTDDGRIIIANAVYDMQSNVSFKGTVGQPMLVRTLNAGNMWHSPHIHGTHVFPLSHNNIMRPAETFPKLETNLFMIDTWALEPGGIKDVLHPFTIPPDIPVDADVVGGGRKAWPPVDERFPLVYPMHDHNEITNTAAGGNYPHGITTHWQIDADFDPTDPATGVILIDRADLRVKTGQLVVEGRFTVASPSDSDPLFLHLHAGGASGPMITGSIRVGTDGRFRFRGRALKALGRRFVTLMHHGHSDDNGNGDDHVVVHAVRTVPLRLR
ncbi:multicopper oxidase domain-containing protein [Geoalkalibacter halelectricus]|uniref:Multicopper oxidase domain-containing protein n=1 Tax=Geoalkalibacter halelectricus TaxID=2847045 RepID=A0ABY5ZP84_9BACT|nr:multicopper oxidase domain-containing protein [Geoalkalibacter halelectricus]MDO3378356.1 multicopper oxidase domain-containing protein [Geoalkalibacter halelectricus]UWZ80324.1 multicopper oxidase domain-containing protein [Geoalkalibacter halelectricus]